MYVYVLTDGNGNYIRNDESTGKYVPVRGEKYAKQFPTSQKALSILQNSVAKNIRSNYNVAAIEDKDVFSIETVKDLVDQEIIDDEILNWSQNVDSVLDMINRAKNRKDELTEKISTVDKEITDIQHYIELNRINAYQGWLSASMLQNRLRQRRKYKDELSILNAILNSGIDAVNMQGVKAAISNLSGRRYAPRILTELFKK